MEKEIWADIKGYEGLYQVSTYGRVRSINYRHSGCTKFLKQIKNKFGYFRVMLYKDGVKRRLFYVHCLVAEAFIPNWFDDCDVNHRDEDKTNNHISNLEYCDRKYNVNYGTRNRRISTKLTNGKMSKQVLQYTKDGDFVKEWSSVHEINRQKGYDCSHIFKCCSNKRKSAYGFIWKYKKEVV